MFQRISPPGAGDFLELPADCLLILSTHKQTCECKKKKEQAAIASYSVYKCKPSCWHSLWTAFLRTAAGWSASQHWPGTVALCTKSRSLIYHRNKTHTLALIFTNMSNLESPMRLNVTLLACGGRPDTQTPHREATQALGLHAGSECKLRINESIVILDMHIIRQRLWYGSAFLMTNPPRPLHYQSSHLWCLCVTFSLHFITHTITFPFNDLQPG